MAHWRTAVYVLPTGGFLDLFLSRVILIQSLCQAWILADLNMPLKELYLMVADMASGRAEHIHHLNRGTCRELNFNLSFEAMMQLGVRRLTHIDEVLRGMGAPATASTNWPSIVRIDGRWPVRNFCDPNEAICRYGGV
jgi:hypothetical protein